MTETRIMLNAPTGHPLYFPAARNGRLEEIGSSGCIEITQGHDMGSRVFCISAGTADIRILDGEGAEVKRYRLVIAENAGNP
ncbi:MAG: hypothetical protein OXC91_15190 [Rhodobacteraceae bacterium]|nr:hypothetical protein [Paracoccaceae bacterium]